MFVKLVVGKDEVLVGDEFRRKRQREHYAESQQGTEFRERRSAAGSKGTRLKRKASDGQLFDRRFGAPGEPSGHAGSMAAIICSPRQG